MLTTDKQNVEVVCSVSRHSKWAAHHVVVTIIFNYYPPLVDFFGSQLFSNRQHWRFPYKGHRWSSASPQDSSDRRTTGQKRHWCLIKSTIAATIRAHLFRDCHPAASSSVQRNHQNKVADCNRLRRPTREQFTGWLRQKRTYIHTWSSCLARHHKLFFCQRHRLLLNGAFAQKSSGMFTRQSLRSDRTSRKPPKHPALNWRLILISPAAIANDLNAISSKNCHTIMALHVLLLLIPPRHYYYYPREEDVSDIRSKICYILLSRIHIAYICMNTVAACNSWGSIAPSFLTWLEWGDILNKPKNGAFIPFPLTSNWSSVLSLRRPSWISVDGHRPNSIPIHRLLVCPRSFDYSFFRWLIFFVQLRFTSLVNLSLRVVLSPSSSYASSSK